VARSAAILCSVDGTSASGGAVNASHDPRSLSVFPERDRLELDPRTWKPSGRGIEVLDDDAKDLCNHDLALVHLEQPITLRTVAHICRSSRNRRGPCGRGTM
jgi:hypothetical protein